MKVWSFTIKPSDTAKEGTPQDLALAKKGVGRKPASKTGIHDAGVLVGQRASWSRGCPCHSVAAPQTGGAEAGQAPDPVDPRALRALGVDGAEAPQFPTRVDALGGHRTIAEIQAWGRWESAKPMGRYKRAALLTRQVSLLPADLVQNHGTTVKNLEEKFDRVMESF